MGRVAVSPAVLVRLVLRSARQRRCNVACRSIIVEGESATINRRAIAGERHASGWTSKLVDLEAGGRWRSCGTGSGGTIGDVHANDIARPISHGGRVAVQKIALRIERRYNNERPALSLPAATG